MLLELTPSIVTHGHYMDEKVKALTLTTGTLHALADNPTVIRLDSPNPTQTSNPGQENILPDLKNMHHLDHFWLTYIGGIHSTFWHSANPAQPWLSGCDTGVSL